MNDLGLEVEARMDVQYVKKHNAIIHSSCDLGLLQKKLANCLLFNAYYSLEEDNIYEIRISQIMNILQMNTRNYKKIKEAILTLMKTVVEWNVLKNSYSANNENNEVWTASTLLSSVQMDGVIIRYEYSKFLKLMLLNPSQFTKIKLNIQNKFRSVYGLTLYENCLRFLNIGTSGWLSLKLFKKLMGVHDSKYTEFKDLSSRVLKPALREINALSDITVCYEIKKVNRFVTALKFNIKKNSNDLNEEEVNQNKSAINSKRNIIKLKEPINCNQEQLSIIEKFKTYGISKLIAEKLINSYDLEYLIQKINLVDSKKSSIKNPAGFLRKAIKDDYFYILKEPTSTLKERDKYVLEKEKLAETLEAEDLQIKSWLNSLIEEEKENLMEQYKEYLMNTSFPGFSSKLIKGFNESGLNNRLVFSFFKVFLSTNKNIRVSLPVTYNNTEKT